MSDKTPLLSPQAQQTRQRQDEQIGRVQSQIQDTQRVMGENIHLAIQRGQNLNELDDKAVMLEHESTRFKEKSSAVRRNMCAQYYRQLAILIIAVLAIVGFIAFMIWINKKK